MQLSLFRTRIALAQAFLCALLVLSAAAQNEPQDLSGRWILDRDLTTADLARNRVTAIEITEDEDEIRFEYFNHDKRIAAESFTTDNRERYRYTTRIVRAYARAKWEPQGLSITTRAFLDAQGYQSYYEYDLWQLAEEGKQLINRSGDGKVTVYYKADPAQR